MKSWIFSCRVHPPTERVFSARNGGSVFSAAFSRVLNQWYMVIPGSGEEKIDEPQMIFVDAEYAKANTKDIGRSVRRPTIRLREGKHKSVQYQLAL